VSKELHLEEAGRANARDPGRIGTPGPRDRKRLELFVEALETPLGKAVQPVVEDSPHVAT
jgi:hypothetical protein